MSLLSEKVNAPSLHSLLFHELQDLYDAEFQILDALPKLIEASSLPELKKAFRDHMKETEHQVSRLEQCFALINEKPKRSGCDGMKGVLKEGDHVLKGKMDPETKDDGIIMSAQRVEHYEMAGYGAAREHAKVLGYKEMAELLHETLQEEGNADHTLSAIAKSKHKKMATAGR